MTSNEYRVSLEGDENVLQLMVVSFPMSVNMLTANELYTLNGQMLWYVNFISIKLLKNWQLDDL